MAYENPIFCHSFPAGGDLSAKQYHFVKLSSGQVVVCTGATDKPVGVLQNKPDAAGKMATVLMVGISKVVGDADLAVDDLIGTSADGQADAKVPGTDTTEYVVGRVLGENTAAGGIVSAAINCLNPHRAA